MCITCIKTLDLRHFIKQKPKRKNDIVYSYHSRVFHVVGFLAGFVVVKLGLADWVLKVYARFSRAVGPTDFIFVGF